MNSSYLSQCLSISIDHIRNHWQTWLKLCLGSLAMFVGLWIAMCLAGLTLGAVFVALFASTTGYVFLKALLFIFLMIVLGYKISVLMINVASIPLANALDVAEGKTARKFQNRHAGSSLYWGYVIYHLLSSIGLLLLVVPGIIFYTRCYFYRLIILETNCSSWQAIKASWNMTSNNFWDIFWLTFGDIFCPVLRCLNVILPIQDLPAARMCLMIKADQASGLSSDSKESF